MEDPKSIEEYAPGQVLKTALTSSKNKAASTLTPASAVIDEKVDSDYHQETATENSELNLMQYVPDNSQINKDTSVGGNADANSLWGNVAKDSEYLLEQNVPNVLNLNPSSSCLQGMAEDYSKASHRDVFDFSPKHNQPDVPENFKVLGSPVGEAAVGQSEASGHQSISEKSEQELGENVQKPEDGFSTKIVDSHMSDTSNSTLIRRTEETPAALAVKLSQPTIAAKTKQSTLESAKSTPHAKVINTSRGLVDTAAPIESVKDVVSKFGGIVDWKAYSAHIKERSKLVRSELEKIRQGIPEVKKQSEAAEEARAQVSKELESTKMIVEELKLNLERAQTEEAQAKQDSELAELRVKELEQGIAGESSIAAKTQQDVAKARYEKAFAELKSVKEELNILEGTYASLLNEKDMAMRKADNAASASKLIEKTVEELTLELIKTKEALELAHAAHLEAEEDRIGAVLARDQDHLTWEKELKQAEEEMERLNQQLLSTKDLKSNLDMASSLLVNLKAELAAYMEAKLNQESGSIKEVNSSDDAKEGKKIKASQALASTRKEIEKVKASIDKAKHEVDFLRVASSSLRSELDREKTVLTAFQQRERMASITVYSLEAELERTKEELEVVRIKEKVAREKMVELPKLLQQAAQEADEAKSAAQMAREALQNAKDEAEQVKVGASTNEMRLNAAFKEIEAAKTSEMLAVAAIKALEESEQAAIIGDVDSPTGVTLPLDEYYNLSKRAHEVEVLANEKLTAAIQQLEAAKNLESKSLSRLEEVQRERDECKEASRIAMEKAEKAKEGKLGAEQELRNWRAEHEQRRKAVDAAKNAVNPLMSPPRSFKRSSESKSFKKDEANILVYPLPDEKLDMPTTLDADNGSKKVSKGKKSLFPRIAATLLAHKKQQRDK